MAEEPVYVVPYDPSGLKRELAERYRFDREAYTEAKAPFVERVVAAAMGR